MDNTSYIFLDYVYLNNHSESIEEA
jgi:hypothetical protein